MNKIHKNPKPLVQPLTTDNPTEMQIELSHYVCSRVLRGGHHSLRPIWIELDELRERKRKYTGSMYLGFRFVKNQ